MKKQWLPILILILIILGWGGYFLYTKGVRITNTSPSSQTPVITESPTTNADALKNTLLTGKTQTCTFHDANGNTETYYMNGVTVRTNIVTATKENVHLFSDGETVYIWVGSEKKGSSVPEIDTHTINTTLQADGVQGFDITAKRDWKCTPWTADSSFLGAPYTVVFTPLNK